MGPMLFCNTVQRLLDTLQSDFVAEYLDDLTLVRAILAQLKVTTDIRRLSARAKCWPAIEHW